MGQQLNKTVKRKRLNNYKKRKKTAHALAKAASEKAGKKKAAPAKKVAAVAK